MPKLPPEQSPKPPPSSPLSQDNPPLPPESPEESPEPQPQFDVLHAGPPNALRKSAVLAEHRHANRAAAGPEQAGVAASALVHESVQQIPIL